MLRTGGGSFPILFFTFLFLLFYVCRLVDIDCIQFSVEGGHGKRNVWVKLQLARLAAGRLVTAATIKKAGWWWCASSLAQSHNPQRVIWIICLPVPCSPRVSTLLLVFSVAAPDVVYSLLQLNRVSQFWQQILVDAGIFLNVLASMCTRTLLHCCASDCWQQLQIIHIYLLCQVLELLLFCSLWDGQF